MFNVKFAGDYGSRPSGSIRAVVFAAVFLMAGGSACAQELYADYNQAGEMVLLAKPHAADYTVDSQEDNDERESEIKVSIYPNPVSDILNIDLEYIADERGYCLVVSDAKGNVIQRITGIFSHTQVSLDGYAPGTYILAVSGGLRKTICKIIKK